MSPTLDLLFLGSGASAPVPELRCLVRPTKSPLGPCDVCLEAQSNPESKNIRGCTSGVIVKQWDDGRRSTILIDSGKTFLSSAVKQLPKNDISRVDAVFLSHIHADATQGLDDLRMFTLANEIQTSIDVYADRATHDAVARRYPALFNSGAGRVGATPVAALRFHVFEYGKVIEIAGIRIKPVAAPHGQTHISDYLGATGLSADDPSVANDRVLPPLYCAAFEIDEKMLWLSDVSTFPDAMMKQLKADRPSGSEDIYDVVALDLTNLKENVSHLGITGFCQAVLRFRAKQTLAVQMSHEIDAYGLDNLGEMIRGGERDHAHDAWFEKAWAHISRVHHLWDDLQNVQPFVRAAYDGLRLSLSDGNIKEVTPKWSKRAFTD